MVALSIMILYRNGGKKCIVGRLSVVTPKGRKREGGKRKKLPLTKLLLCAKQIHRHDFM